MSSIKLCICVIHLFRIDCILGCFKYVHVFKGCNAALQYDILK